MPADRPRNIFWPVLLAIVAAPFVISIVVALMGGMLLGAGGAAHFEN